MLFLRDPPMRILLRAAGPVLADLAATLAFAGVVAITGSPLAAIALGLATGLVQIAWTWRSGRAPGALQWVSLGLVAVFGAATLVTHDLRFMLFKPTLVYAVVAAAMLQRGWMKRYMPAEALVLAPQGQIEAWGYAWAGLMAATAVLNGLFAVFADVRTWALFVGVFPLASKAGLFLVQYVTMRVAARRRFRTAPLAPHPAG